MTVKYPVMFFAALILFTACSPRDIPARPDGLGLEQVEVKIPKAEIWSLGNGLTVYYLRDDFVPMVQGTLYIRGGSYYEAENRLGIASATGSLLREGSIEGVSPEQFDRMLDGSGAAIESEFGSEFGTVGFSALAEDFDRVFKLFSEVVQKPAFSPARLEVWKQLAIDGIQKRRDDPDTIASMSFRELVYGMGSPYSRSITVQSVADVTVEKIRECYKQFVRPNGSILVVTGALSRKEVEAAVGERFGSWPMNHAPLPLFPAVTYVSQPGVYVIEKDIDQAHIIIGHQGPPRFPPDIFPLSIFNRSYLYGSFGGMLFTEIRTTQGLAYDAGGALVPDREKGVLEVELGTRNHEALNAIDAMLSILRRSREELAPDVYFENAKLSARNSFIFKFTTPQAVAARSAALRMLDYPEDFDEQYLQIVPHVSKEEVLEVGKKWIKPDEVVITIVGKVPIEEVKAHFAGKMQVYKMEFDTEPKLVGPVS